jgi:hypothetical protein
LPPANLNQADAPLTAKAALLHPRGIRPRPARSPPGPPNLSSQRPGEPAHSLAHQISRPRRFLSQRSDRHPRRRSRQIPHRGIRRCFQPPHRSPADLNISRHIGAMPFIWLAVTNPDERGYIERNSIAQDSRLADGLNDPGPGWLGLHAAPLEVRQSGLWNVDHVRHHADPPFNDRLDRLIRVSR